MEKINLPLNTLLGRYPTILSKVIPTFSCGLSPSLHPRVVVRKSKSKIYSFYDNRKMRKRIALSLYWRTLHNFRKTLLRHRRSIRRLAPLPTPRKGRLFPSRRPLRLFNLLRKILLRDKINVYRRLRIRWKRGYSPLAGNLRIIKRKLALLGCVRFVLPDEPADRKPSPRVHSVTRIVPRPRGTPRTLSPLYKYLSIASRRQWWKVSTRHLSPSLPILLHRPVQTRLFVRQKGGRSKIRKWRTRMWKHRSNPYLRRNIITRALLARKKRILRARIIRRSFFYKGILRDSRHRRSRNTLSLLRRKLPPHLATFSTGRVYVTFKHNNTFITLTRANPSKVVHISNAGIVGFKGPARSTAFAREAVARDVSGAAFRKNIKLLDIYFSSFGKVFWFIIKGLTHSRVHFRTLILKKNKRHGFIRLRKERRK